MQKVVQKRSIVVGGHKTSITLEEVFWQEVRRIAVEQSLTIGQFITAVDSSRAEGSNLSSALRLAVIHNLHAKLASPRASANAA